MVGSARTIRSLKELVPMSMAANRLFGEDMMTAGGGGVGDCEGDIGGGGWDGKRVMEVKSVWSG